MAALDFPANPTVGQQYNGTNGVVYQWDGTVWILTGPWAGAPAGGVLSGTYPNPGFNGANTVYPYSAGELTSWGTGIDLRANTGEPGSNNTMAQWIARLDYAGDKFMLMRNPPAGGSFPTLLTLDNAGDLTIPGTLRQATNGCNLVRAAALTIPQNAMTDVPWDTATWQRGAPWNSGDPTHIYLSPGLYLICTQMTWNTNSSVNNVLQVYNAAGADIGRDSRFGSTAGWVVAATASIYLAGASDWIKVSSQCDTAAGSLVGGQTHLWVLRLEI